MKKAILLLGLFLVTGVLSSNFLHSENSLNKTILLTKDSLSKELKSHSHPVMYHEYGGEPTVFEDSNCRGSYSYVNVSRSNLNSYGWNDAVSSVVVPRGWVLKFYKHKDFCGSTFTVNPGTHNFSDYDWNDKASSVEVFYYGELQGYSYPCPSNSKSHNKKKAFDPTYWKGPNNPDY